jgi:hypothetical protein
MQIEPWVPLTGLFLIILNVAIAVLRPYWLATLLGIQMFIGGLTTLTISVVHLVNPVGIEGAEQFLAFVTGSLNCTIAYFMVLYEGEGETESEQRLLSPFKQFYRQTVTYSDRYTADEPTSFQNP